MKKVLKRGGSDILRRKILAKLFYEPSTRTSMSSGVAMQRLGGEVHSETGIQFSSLYKGESIKDSIRVISGMVDIICMRHKEEGSAAIAAEASKKEDGTPVPFVNCGDGPGEHPTQALLDMYTIKKETGRTDGLTIALAGDLKYGRTVHSLAYLAGLYGNRLRFIAPELLAMPEDVKEDLRSKGILFEESENIEDGLDADVLYMTRVQRERFEEAGKLEEYERLKDIFVLRERHVKDRDVTILHPLPKTWEVAPDVDNLPNAAFWRQAENGVPIRMAIFAMLLGKA